MTQVYYLDVNCLKNQTVFKFVYSALTRERQKEALRYRLEQDRLLSLGAGYLLQLALQRRGVGVQTVRRGEHGKPYFERGELRFNLSHSGNIAACALSDGEVGLDVEEVKERPEPLIMRVTTTREYDDLFQAQERQIQFTRLWTVKESYMKLTGLGLSLPPKEIEFDFETRSLYCHGERQAVFLREYPLNGYCMTVCAVTDGFSVEKIIL